MACIVCWEHNVSTHKDLQSFTQLETVPTALQCGHKSMPRKLHKPQTFLKRSLNPDTLLRERRNLSHMDMSWIMPPSLGSAGKSLECFIYLYLLCRHSISDNLTGTMIIKLFFFNIFLSLLSLLTFRYDLATNNK